MVNVAGYLRPGRTQNLIEVDIDRHIDINLKGVIHGTQLAGQLMMKQDSGGHIINVSSLGALAPVSGIVFVLYALQKTRMLCMHIHIYIHTHTHIYICICTYKCVCVYMYMCMCVCIYIVHMYVYTCIHIHMCTHVNVYIHAYTYIGGLYVYMIPLFPLMVLK
jgi:hypothetical protein